MLLKLILKKNWDSYIPLLEYEQQKVQNFHNLGSQLFIKYHVFLVSFLDVEKYLFLIYFWTAMLKK